MKTAAIFTVAVAAISISSPSERQRSLPSIDSQVTFLYYKDVRAAALFYAGTLGLEMTFDEGWVQIYRAVLRRTSVSWTKCAARIVSQSQNQ